MIGQAVVGRLAWSDEGRQRFREALSASKGLAGYQSVLWFGFGIKHIIHALATQTKWQFALPFVLAYLHATLFFTLLMSSWN